MPSFSARKASRLKTLMSSSIPPMSSVPLLSFLHPPSTATRHPTVSQGTLVFMGTLLRSSQTRCDGLEDDDRATAGDAELARRARLLAGEAAGLDAGGAQLRRRRRRVARQIGVGGHAGQIGLA